MSDVQFLLLYIYICIFNIVMFGRRSHLSRSVRSLLLYSF